MKVVIVIPTYNELGNIKKIIPALSQEFVRMPKHKFNLLVVDGNSPDGTADEVKKLSKKFPFVNLLVEKKKAGLGAAYVYAFRKAMKTFKPDVIVEMDSDFQHNPKDVKYLVEAIQDGYDYAIGSRFTKGGSIPKEWAIHRKFLSIGGNLFSKIVLGIFNVNDFTSGFKASRVKGFVDKLDLDNILSSGFAYKVDLLFKMHRLGAKIKEVPIAFGVRDRGDSKMESNNSIDTLKVVLMLQVNENKRFFKFVVVGFIGLFIDTGLFNLLRLFSIITSSFSAFISGSLAMLTTFLLNNNWSFGDRKLSHKKDKVFGIVVYFVSSYIPILVRTKLVQMSVSFFGDRFLTTNVAFFIGIVFGLVWNFTVYSKIIWKEKK